MKTMMSTIGAGALLLASLTSTHAATINVYMQPGDIYAFLDISWRFNGEESSFNDDRYWSPSTRSAWTSGDYQDPIVSAEIEEDACWTFEIIDAGNDGLCCNFGESSYAIAYDPEDGVAVEKIVYFSDGQFKSGETIQGCGAKVGEDHQQIIRERNEAAQRAQEIAKKEQSLTFLTDLLEQSSADSEPSAEMIQGMITDIRREIAPLEAPPSVSSKDKSGMVKQGLAEVPEEDKEGWPCLASTFPVQNGKLACSSLVFKDDKLCRLTPDAGYDCRDQGKRLEFVCEAGKYKVVGEDGFTSEIEDEYVCVQSDEKFCVTTKKTPCVFPYSAANGQQYWHCIPHYGLIPDSDGHDFWCPTKIARVSQHIADSYGKSSTLDTIEAWGFCETECGAADYGEGQRDGLWAAVEGNDGEINLDAVSSVPLPPKHAGPNARGVAMCSRESTKSAGTPECTCDYVGKGTEVSVQLLCLKDNVCYNVVNGWCAEDEEVCEVPR